MFLGKKKPSGYRKPFFPADTGLSQDLCKEDDAYLLSVRIGDDPGWHLFSGVDASFLEGDPQIQAPSATGSNQIAIRERA